MLMCCLLCRVMDNPVTRVNLLDPCMRLPLEHRIIPCLSAKAAGRLACTSKIFRDLLYHDLLEHDFYAQLALNNLGPTHPVLLAQVRPRPTLLQVAMSRCERARVNMKAGQYTQSKMPHVRARCPLPSARNKPACFACRHSCAYYALS